MTEQAVVTCEPISQGRFARCLYSPDLVASQGALRQLLAEQTSSVDEEVDAFVIRRMGEAGWKIVHVSEKHWFTFHRHR